MNAQFNAQVILDVVEAGHRDPTAITELNKAFLAMANPTRDIPAERWAKAFRSTNQETAA